MDRLVEGHSPRKSRPKAFTNRIDNGARGVDLFGCHRLLFRDPGVDSSGLIGFYQLGANDSDALLARQYVGGGLSAFGLVPGRADDTFGVGLAWAWLTRGDQAGHVFGYGTPSSPQQISPSQLMLQAYYQMKLRNGLFFQTALTEIPNPAANESIPNALALTLRVIALFRSPAPCGPPERELHLREGCRPSLAADRDSHAPCLWPIEDDDRVRFSRFPGHFRISRRRSSMDLPTVSRVRRPARAGEIDSWEPGFAWLAGGTWLFSEPQSELHTLIDLETLRWPSLRTSESGLEIASTCRVVELDRFADDAPPDWAAAPLFRLCCRSFLASFKIWNEATVGGNVCMSLPAGPMISLATALEGGCTLWPRRGEPREVTALDFVTGNNRNVLGPGELLRSIALPAHALRKAFAFRRFTLTHHGRSEALLIGTLCPERGEFLLTITAATLRPIQVRFASVPEEADLRRAIDDAVPFSLYLDDVHGSPAHRKHLTHYFAEQVRSELSLRILSYRDTA